MGRLPYILIAEDDEDDRFLLETAFRENQQGVQLSFVRDGLEIMNYLDRIDRRRPLPDLILLDVNMPLMGGTETLRLLKEDDRYKKIPVIIHSTSDSELDKHRCMNLGASGYLHKGSGFEKVRAAAHFIYEFLLFSGKK